jgi:uncharacterized protein DUF2510
VSDPTPAGPGWYADPRETHLWRCWTGEKWSNLVAKDIALPPPANLDSAQNASRSITAEPGAVRPSVGARPAHHGRLAQT